MLRFDGLRSRQAQVITEAARHDLNPDRDVIGD
jgi:hypothetical protein